MKKYTECEDCGGQGTVLVAKLYPHGHFEGKEGCGSCGGSGEVEAEEELQIIAVTHTPGTWTLGLEYAQPHYTKAQWIEIQSNGKLIAEVKGQHHSVPETEMHANAKIMAMAPIMLETLIYIKNLIDNHEEWWMDSPNKGGFDMDVINGVITKATE